MKISVVCSICLVTLTTQLYAQDNLFSFGLVSGVDHILARKKSVNEPIFLSGTTVRYITSFSYGITGVYLHKRVLYNASLLRAYQTYEVMGPDYYNPALLARIAVSANYYSLPITVSYQLPSVKQISLYVGAGIIPEVISGEYIPTSYDLLGSSASVRLTGQKPDQTFHLGGLLQATGRYIINHRLIAQLQPTLQYFRQETTPFAWTNKSSFNITLSATYRLNKERKLLYF